MSGSYRTPLVLIDSASLARPWASGGVEARTGNDLGARASVAKVWGERFRAGRLRGKPRGDWSWWFSRDDFHTLEGGGWGGSSRALDGAGRQDGQAVSGCEDWCL